MSKKNIVIASHSLDEAITKCIIKNKEKFDKNIAVILLEEFISSYEIFDELSDSGAIIKWHNKHAECISNKDYVLLNRVLYFPKNVFANFINKDREYAQREFEAYLGFAFNAFQGVGNKTTKGLCAEILPLPQQWYKVMNEFNATVPNYYWGPRYANTLSNKNPLVYSNIYNFLNWTTTNYVDEKEHIFCFEKPHGEPVFIFSIGGQQLITTECHLSEDMTVKILALTKNITNTLNYFISETLIFVDEMTVTFGCVNAEILRSNKNIVFDKFVCDNLMNEFYKCID